MEEPVKLRLQIRAVLIAYRAEMARLGRSSRSDENPTKDLSDLRTRCLLILDAARAGLDGQAASHPDLLDELARARAQVTRKRRERTPDRLKIDAISPAMQSRWRQPGR